MTCILQHNRAVLFTSQHWYLSCDHMQFLPQGNYDLGSQDAEQPESDLSMLDIPGTSSSVVGDVPVDTALMIRMDQPWSHLHPTRIPLSQKYPGYILAMLYPCIPIVCQPRSSYVLVVFQICPSIPACHGHIPHFSPVESSMSKSCPSDASVSSFDRSFILVMYIPRTYTHVLIYIYIYVHQLSNDYPPTIIHQLWLIVNNNIITTTHIMNNQFAITNQHCHLFSINNQYEPARVHQLLTTTNHY